MATRTFNVSTDAHVVYDPYGAGKGAGKDVHLCIGNVSGYIYRSLLKFTLDYSGMYGITSAVLNFRTADAYHGSTNTESVLVRRNTSAWSEGTYGADHAFYTANAVTWDNKPSTTTTGGVTYSHTGTNDTWDSVDITDIVKAWAPTSIPGGGGLSNYGITLRQESEVSGNFVDLWSREKGTSYDAYITVTYSDTPPQTNPTATHVSPAANGLAEIYNLATDLTTPSADDTGFTARCQFRFTYSDTEGHSMSKYQVQVYQSDGTTLVHDSGQIVATAASGSTVIYQAATWEPSADTEYKWKVTVWDNYSTPGSSTTALTSFKLRWGYAISRIDLGATGATGLSATVTPASAATNTRRAIFYRGHDGSTGKSNWGPSVGSINTGTYRYVEVYTRLSSDVSGTNPQIDKVSISYQAAGTQPLPLKWYLTTPTAGRWVIDEGERRYGSKSLKGEGVGGTSRWIVVKPALDKAVSTYKIPVTPDTNYCFSCYVKTDGPLPTGANLYIQAYTADGSTPFQYVDTDSTLWETTDTSASPEGWKRLVVRLRTGPDDTSGIFQIVYDCSTDTAARGTFWIDGAALTEGAVVPPWAQGTVAPAGTVSATGIEIDGAAGGELLLRGKDGGSRDVVALGASGLELGGATAPVAISSPAAGQIALGATSINAGGSSFPTSPAASDRYFRTDLGMEFVYGTFAGASRWVSTQLFTVSAPGYTTAFNTAITATLGNVFRLTPPSLLGGSDILLVSWKVGYNLAAGTGPDASNKWALAMIGYPAGDTISTLTIDSGSEGTWEFVETTIDALLGSTRRSLLNFSWNKTGSPGALTMHSPVVTYRVVAT